MAKGISMKKQVPTRLDEELIKWLKVISKKENRSLNNVIETILFEKYKNSNAQGKD